MRDLLLRLWREEHGWGRIWTGLAMAVALAGGGLVYQQVTQNGPASGTANLWIDTNGGTCTRSSGAVAYSDGAACSTYDAAWEAASCGDTVLVKAGSYSAQTVSGTKSCSSSWSVGATSGVSCSSCVTIGVAPGESVTLGGVDFTADYVVVELGQGTALTITNGVGFVSRSTNVAVKDATITKDVFFNTNATTGPYTNLGVVGGTVGGFDLFEPGGPLLAVYFQTCASGSNQTLGSGILIDGVSFHDLDTPDLATPDHTGVIRFDGGWNGITVRNSDFYDNILVTTSTLQSTNLSGCGINPTNLVIENNYFGESGPGGRAFNCNSVLSNCGTYTFRYNTFEINAYTDNGSSTGVSWYGNLGVKSTANCWGTHVKNVWQHSSNVACGTDTWVNGTANGWGNLGLGGASGFELQAGSPALQAGETSQCPAFDHDANARPAPGATNCDAGANERNE